MKSFNYEIVFRHKANTDFIKAYTWYEEQQEGLGEQFFDAILSKNKIISADPYLYKSVYKKYHEVLLDRFLI